jgi:hypothetical protein
MAGGWDVCACLTPTKQTYSLSSRQATGILLRQPSELKPEQQVWLYQLQPVCPPGRTRHELAQQFLTVVRAKQVSGLDAQLQPAEDSIVRELGSLAGGLRGA